MQQDSKHETEEAAHTTSSSGSEKKIHRTETETLLEVLEQRFQQMECRVLPLEAVTWEASNFINPNKASRSTSSPNGNYREGSDLYNQVHSGGSNVNKKGGKSNLLSRLSQIEENFKSIETPIIKDFLQRIQEFNVFEYESYLSDAKMMSEFDKESGDLSSALLKKNMQWKYIEEREHLVEYLNRQFEELERLLPLLDMLNDRNQLTNFCKDLEDLKTFHVSIENLHGLSEQQAEIVQQQLCSYNDLVSIAVD